MSLEEIDSGLSLEERSVLDWLRNNAALTDLEAELNLKISPLEPIISELRAHGHQIQPVTHNRPEGVNSPAITVYWLCSCDETMQKLLDHLLLHGGWSPDSQA